MIKNLAPQATECGKIKLGGLGRELTSRSGSKYRQPEKYDAFVLTRTYRSAAGDLVRDEGLMTALERDPDGKLRAIPICVHSDDIEEIMPTSYARYAGRKLHCSGNGEEATRWEIADKGGAKVRTGENKTVTCPCQYLDENERGERSCKPHAIFYCSIRVPGMAVAGAVHTFRTTSIISIQRLYGSLLQIKKTVGLIQGLPLWLVVQPVVTDRATVYCAHVELRAADIAAAQVEALGTARRRAELVSETAEFSAQYRRMLTAPAVESEPDEEQAAVQQEFHPETPAENITSGSIDALLDIDDEPARAKPARKKRAAKTSAPVSGLEQISAAEALGAVPQGRAIEHDFMTLYRTLAAEHGETAVDALIPDMIDLYGSPSELRDLSECEDVDLSAAFDALADAHEIGGIK